MRIVVPAILSFIIALPAFAAGPTLESAASDVEGLIRTLKKETAQDQTQVEVAMIGGIWHETQCMDVVFEEKAGPESNIHILTSTTWIEDCRNIPLPNPPGGGMCIPDRRPWSHAASFVVEVVGRSAPGPKEVFEVCMTGPWLKFGKVKQSPNKYDVKEVEEGRITRFKLTKKVPKPEK